MKRGLIKMQKNYNLDDELENLEITEQHFEKAAFIPAKKGRKTIGKRVSIILPDELIKSLMVLGKEKGLGYQTLARVMLVEKVEELKAKKKKVG